jgi:hypothetical protein
MLVIVRRFVPTLAVQHGAAQACTMPVSQEKGTTTFRKIGTPRAHDACRGDGSEPGASHAWVGAQMPWENGHAA